MGSFLRKLKRTKDKRAYGSLKNAWRAEKRAQGQLLDAGEELPENTPKLGRAPNFQEFLEIQQRVTLQMKLERAPNPNAEIPDLGWTEEEAEKPQQ